VLIGREPELAVLERHVADRKPVAITGDAGIGKTTLLVQVASAPGRRARIGQGLRTLSWMSYMPLERALGMRLDTGDDGAKARSIAARLGPDLLVVDDLQWADEETLRLIPHVGRLARLLVAIRTDDPSAATTLDAVDAEDFAKIDLKPLSDDAAEILLQQKRPTLSVLERRDVLERAGGNPLLLEEMQPSGGASLNLRIVLAGLVHGLSPRGQRLMAILGLLGHAAGRGVFSGHETELIDAGLALETDEGLVARHALIGEVAADALADEERRDLHSWLAHRLEEPGEAAQHHLAAGELNQGKEKALLAADRARHAGELARSLLVAVRCDCVGDTDLRLSAADALIRIGDYQSALEIAASVRSTDRETRARSLLHQARATRSLYGQRDAISLADRALELVAGTESDTEVQVLLERARIDWKRWGTTGVELTRRALSIARGTDLEASCTMELGSALYASGSSDAIPVLRNAVALATSRGDRSLRCEAGVMLAACLHAHRRIQEAVEEVEATVRASRSAGLRAAELDAMWLEMLLRGECLGQFDHAIDVGYVVAQDPGAAADARHSATGMLTILLMERGRIEEAQALLDQVFSSERVEAVEPWLGRAEIELLLGRPQRAVDAIDQAANAWPQNVNLCFLWPVRGWASLELGWPVVPFPGPEPAHPLGSQIELEALTLLADGRTRRAEQRFEEAALANLGSDLRAELRCRWGAGESALRAGAVGRARERLLEVEETAQGFGMNATLSRIRSSLRAAGVRRGAPRGARLGDVTPREREALDLVNRGHDSRAIAGLLGISPETVDDLIESAMVKLGARTRIEAANMPTHTV
jgi:DNA-binding CsgD family transcriptional regulator/tetratricopeptide (TPR) repeat protein